MRRTVFAFTIATLICAATYETCHAAPIAYRHSHQYIVNTAHAPLCVSHLLVATRPVSLVSFWGPGTLGVLV